MLKTKSRILLTILLLLTIFLFVLNPNLCIQASLNGLKVWLINIVPALFPFFILTRLLISINQNSIPFLDNFTTLCFRTENSGLIYFLSILSGYPVGAKMISNYYSLGIIDKECASKMLSFCSTSGPMFIVGTVGIGIFRSAKIGYILLISHIIGSFLNGLLYRGKPSTVKFCASAPSKTTLNDTMYDSIISILLVGGYIIFSFVIIELLKFQILPLLAKCICIIPIFDYNTTLNFLCGICEITNGIIGIGKLTIGISIKIVLTSILIAFSGICIMLQSLAFINKIGIRKSTMLLQKFTQSIFSGLATILILLVI